MSHSSCLASGLPAMQGLACRDANGLFAGSARGDAPRPGREPAAPDSAATSSQCSNRSSVRHGHWRHSTVGHRGGRGAARRVPGGEGQSVNLSRGRARTRVPLWSTTTGAPDARSTSCCFRAAMTICSRESRKMSCARTWNTLGPAASRPSTVPTVTRQPRMHALPPMTVGSRVIRFSTRANSF